MVNTSFVKVAALQINSGSQVEKNLDAIEPILEHLHRLECELAVLPEGFACLADASYAHIAESLEAESLNEEGPILSRCKKWARTYQMELVLGGFWERSSVEDKVHNACIFLNRAGEVVDVYRKMHLFDICLPGKFDLKESNQVVRGQVPVVVPSCLGPLGLSICYDLRFPELYRALIDRGAQALVVPAAFTMETGKDHWEVLLRARAIESQSYVIAAAQTGLHYGTRRSYGHAMIVDAWGTVRAACGEAPGFAFAHIDRDHTKNVRMNFPALQHRCIG